MGAMTVGCGYFVDVQVDFATIVFASIQLSSSSVYVRACRVEAQEYLDRKQYAIVVVTIAR